MSVVTDAGEGVPVHANVEEELVEVVVVVVTVVVVTGVIEPV